MLKCLRNTFKNILLNCCLTLSNKKLNSIKDNEDLFIYSKVMPTAYLGETSNRLILCFNYHKQSNKNNSSGFPVVNHFNYQSQALEDLCCIIIKNNIPDMDNRTLINKTTIKYDTHSTHFNKERYSISQNDLYVVCI